MKENREKLEGNGDRNINGNRYGDKTKTRDRDSDQGQDSDGDRKKGSEGRNTKPYLYLGCLIVTRILSSFATSFSQTATEHSTAAYTQENKLFICTQCENTFLGIIYLGRHKGTHMAEN